VPASQALSRNQAVHANSSDSKIKTLDRFNIDVATQNGLLPDLNIIAPLVNDVEPRTGSRLNDYNSFLNGANGPNKHLWWYQSCNPTAAPASMARLATLRPTPGRRT